MRLMYVLVSWFDFGWILMEKLESNVCVSVVFWYLMCGMCKCEYMVLVKVVRC